MAPSPHTLSQAVTVAFRLSGTRSTVNLSWTSIKPGLSGFGGAITALVQSSKERVKRRVLSFIVGHPGWLRNQTMALMCHFRRQLPPSELEPDFRFVRTLQAPDHIVFDEHKGLYRISSKAFGPSSSDGSLSGDLEQLLVRDGLTATAMYPAVDRAIGAAALTVGQICKHGPTVHHEPVQKNWYHGGVRGIRSSTKKKLLGDAVEIVPIDQAQAASWHTRRQLEGLNIESGYQAS
jgi:hypothetical protein